MPKEVESNIVDVWLRYRKYAEKMSRNDKQLRELLFLFCLGHNKHIVERYAIRVVKEIDNEYCGENNSDDTSDA